MRFAMFILVLVAAPAAAHAQFSSPYTGGVYVDPVNSLGMTVHTERMRDMVMSTYQDRRPGKPAKRHPIAASDFKGSGKRLMEEEYYRALGVNDEQKKALGVVIDRVFAAFEKEARKRNCAYALALMLGVAAQIKTGVEIPDDRAEVLALDINDALAVDPAFKKMKAVDRQKMYESCLILTALIVTFSEGGKRTDRPEMTRAAAEMADQLLAGMKKK